MEATARVAQETFHQLTNQPTNQPTNQSTNQPTSVLRCSDRWLMRTAHGDIGQGPDVCFKMSIAASLRHGPLRLFRNIMGT